jgi:hypothetical protein
LPALDFDCNSFCALAHAEAAFEYCLSWTVLFYEMLKSLDYLLGTPQKAGTSNANLYLYHGQPSRGFG